MRTTLPALGICLLLLGSAQTGDRNTEEKEIELLRGTWSVDVAAGGNKLKGQFAIYGDESFEINIAGNRINSVRKIDPTKKPKEITLTPDNSKKPLYGIYELKGDTLMLCLGEKRPTQFKAKPGATLWALKREKEKGK